MELLPHQIVAIEKFRNVKAALIGDSMGVGKTVTGIGRDLDLRERYGKSGAHIRTLIICTKNGISVWRHHLLQFGIPETDILAINPRDRSVFEKELKNGARKFRYYIVHWDVLTKLEDLNSGKHAVVWDHVIADEVHFAKNRQAVRTREFKRIKCRVKTALTGTPADDKPQDIWSILNWLYPKHYTSYWRFFNEYIVWNDFNGYREIEGVQNIAQLHKEIEPFYIRRTLHDVRDDMPEKTRTKYTVELTLKQRKIYDQMANDSIAMIGDNQDIVVAPIMLSVLTRLQKLALGTCRVTWTPEQWDAYYEALTRYEDEIQEWELNNRRGKKPKRPAGPPLKVEEPSPKLDLVMDLIETHEEEPFVVFTQFSDMADLVEAACKRKKIPVSKITGAVMDQSERQKAVMSFQEGATRVFVGTIGAAGTTITLNRAHTAIFVDRSWKNGDNDQAEDRIFRIDNDTQPIQIIDIVAKDTVDGYRLDKLEQKAEWVKKIIDPYAIIEGTSLSGAA